MRLNFSVTEGGPVAVLGCRMLDLEQDTVFFKQFSQTWQRRSTDPLNSRWHREGFEQLFSHQSDANQVFQHLSSKECRVYGTRFWTESITRDSLFLRGSGPLGKNPGILHTVPLCVMLEYPPHSTSQLVASVSISAVLQRNKTDAEYAEDELLYGITERFEDLESFATVMLSVPLANEPAVPLTPIPLSSRPLCDILHKRAKVVRSPPVSPLLAPKARQPVLPLLSLTLPEGSPDPQAAGIRRPSTARERKFGGRPLKYVHRDVGMSFFRARHKAWEKARGGASASQVDKGKGRAPQDGSCEPAAHNIAQDQPAYPPLRDPAIRVKPPVSGRTLLRPLSSSHMAAPFVARRATPKEPSNAKVVQPSELANVASGPKPSGVPSVASRPQTPEAVGVASNTQPPRIISATSKPQAAETVNAALFLQPSAPSGVTVPERRLRRTKAQTLPSTSPVSGNQPKDEAQQVVTRQVEAAPEAEQVPRPASTFQPSDLISESGTNSSNGRLAYAGARALLSQMMQDGAIRQAMLERGPDRVLTRMFRRMCTSDVMEFFETDWVIFEEVLKSQIRKMQVAPTIGQTPSLIYLRDFIGHKRSADQLAELSIASSDLTPPRGPGRRVNIERAPEAGPSTHSGRQRRQSPHANLGAEG